MIPWAVGFIYDTAVSSATNVLLSLLSLHYNGTYLSHCTDYIFSTQERVNLLVWRQGGLWDICWTEWTLLKLKHRLWSAFDCKWARNIFFSLIYCAFRTWSYVTHLQVILSQVGILDITPPSSCLRSAPPHWRGSREWVSRHIPRRFRVAPPWFSNIFCLL